jgi:hypothetical protein
VKRPPLHLAHAGATLATLFALVATESAIAHVDVQPRLVERGRETELRIELPQLRAGPAPVRLEVEAEGVSARASIQLGVVGAETRWSVRVRVAPVVPPGDLLLVLRAYFADGESVEVDGGITVVPPAAEPGGTFPWLGVAVGVTVALALGLAALFVARRRSGW